MCCEGFLLKLTVLYLKTLYGTSGLKTSVLLPHCKPNDFFSALTI